MRAARSYRVCRKCKERKPNFDFPHWSSVCFDCKAEVPAIRDVTEPEQTVEEFCEDYFFPSREMEPEERLWLAVLQQALADLMSATTLPEDRADAARLFLDPDRREDLEVLCAAAGGEAPAKWERRAALAVARRRVA